MKALLLLLRACPSDPQPFHEKYRTGVSELKQNPAFELVKTINFMSFSEDDRNGVSQHVALMVWFSKPTAYSHLLQSLQPAWDAAEEAWRVLMEPVKSTGKLEGLAPVNSATPLGNDDPLAVLIWGVLNEDGRTPFYEVSPATFIQARQNPDYLGGVFLTRTGAETGSFSLWRNRRAAAAYAYGSGIHREAMTSDRLETWHDPASDFFARFRLLAADGKLFGFNPLEGIVPTQLDETGNL